MGSSVGQEGKRIEPFAAWISQSYVPLDWWQAYNNVKHDRLANRTQATMKHAAQALAALFSQHRYVPSGPARDDSGGVGKEVSQTDQWYLARGAAR